MKIVETFPIRGRGVLAIIDALPSELECWMVVRSGDAKWTVHGIETHAMPRSHTNGKPAGLLLYGSEPVCVGMELELVALDR